MRPKHLPYSSRITRRRAVSAFDHAGQPAVCCPITNDIDRLGRPGHRTRPRHRPALDSPPLPPSQATAQAMRRGSILAESRRRCQTSGRTSRAAPPPRSPQPGKPVARCPISTAKKKSHPWRQHLGPNSAVSQRTASMIGTRFSRSAAHRPTSPGRQRPVSAPNRPTPKRCREPVPTDDFEGFSVSPRQHDPLEARETHSAPHRLCELMKKGTTARLQLKLGRASGGARSAPERSSGQFELQARRGCLLRQRARFKRHCSSKNVKDRVKKQAGAGRLNLKRGCHLREPPMGEPRLYQTRTLVIFGSKYSAWVYQGPIRNAV